MGRDSTLSFVLAIVGVSLSWAVCGCASDPARLDSQFAAERDCEEPVMVTKLGGNRYRVTGCGRTAEYRCPTLGAAKTLTGCTEQHPSSPAKPGFERRAFKPIQRDPPGGRTP